MNKEVEKRYSEATKIITDNWTATEEVTLQKIQTDLNVSLSESKIMYESIMNHLVTTKVT